ncbi:MAG: hypothetical protein ABIE22_00740 [archaeon]
MTRKSKTRSALEGLVSAGKWAIIGFTTLPMILGPTYGCDRPKKIKTEEVRGKIQDETRSCDHIYRTIIKGSVRGKNVGIGDVVIFDKQGKYKGVHSLENYNKDAGDVLEYVRDENDQRTESYWKVDENCETVSYLVTKKGEKEAREYTDNLPEEFHVE